MACDPITVVRFKELKPQFAAVDNVVVSSYIDLAQLWASGDWATGYCDQVQAAVVCHLMTLDGLGSDPASRVFARGTGEYQSVRSGNVTLTRFRSVAERAGQSTPEWFAQTQCGRMFLAMLRTLNSGPRYAVGSVGACVSGYAKDAYRDGWWVC